MDLVASCMLLVVVLGMSHEANGDSGIVFTSPSVLQKGTVEKSCVTLHDLDHIDLWVSLRDDRVTHWLKNVTLHDSGCFHWDFGDEAEQLEQGNYELQVDGNSGNYRFSQHATVKVENEKDVIFIQTDKPVYKPGQTIKFRVLVVDAKLKPKLQEISEIFVQDPNGIRMMQWRNVEVTRFQGIADLEMLMSDEPIHGIWKITVKTNGGASEDTASFKVEEYVLPKYEIELKLPRFIPVDAENIEGQVCAMYTYGEPVRGHLNLKICRNRTPYVSVQNPAMLCQDISTEITGCEPFSIDADTLKLDHSSHWHSYQKQVTFTASLHENATGVTLNASDTVDVKDNIYKLDFKPYSPDYFKPGLPYHGKVKVTNPDGSPAAGKVVKIEINVYARNKKFEKEFTSDAAGEVKYSLPPLGADSTSISIKCKMPEFSTRSRHRTRDGERRIQPTVNEVIHSIEQWYSPTSSYIQIEPVEDVATCGNPIVLNVTHRMEEDENDITIYYQLISHGNVVGDGTYTHSYGNSNIRIYAPDGTFTEESLNSCSHGRVWNDCQSPNGKSHCRATCRDISQSCSYPCFPGCQCPQPNYIYHGGRCIHPNDCPVKSFCSGGREWMECGNACTRTCEVNPLLCTANCVARCQCPTSAPVWHNQRCITQSVCPSIETNLTTTVRPTTRPRPTGDRPIVKIPLRIQVTSEMSPSVKVLLYYIRSDKETVADSAVIKVEQCTANNVNIAFRDRSKYPGDSTTISMRADPGSVCSLGVVDKSVHLMGGKNTLSLSEVLDELTRYDLDQNSIQGEDDYCERKMNGGSARRHKRSSPEEKIDAHERIKRRSPIWGHSQYYSDYIDSMHAFKKTGMIVLFDVEIYQRQCLDDTLRILKEILGRLKMDGSMGHNKYQRSYFRSRVSRVDSNSRLDGIIEYGDRCSYYE